MTEPVGIVDIATYVPEGRLDLRQAAHGLNATPEFLEKKTGYAKVSRAAEGEETSDLAVKAINALIARNPEAAGKIGMLLLVSQNPDAYGLPHVSAIVHGKLGWDSRVAAFDVSLGCSGWVYGLSIAKSFMEANGIEYGVLVTADPYSKVMDEADRNTMLLFGDAAAATLLGRRSVAWYPGKFVFGTDGSRSGDLKVDEQRKLRMNGTAIFTFSATRVPQTIRDVVAANGLALTDIDHVLLHQGSRYIVDTIGARLGAGHKTPFIDNGIGNSVSSTVPWLLSQSEFQRDRRLVACGFGVGLSWAATVLTNARRGDS